MPISFTCGQCAKAYVVSDGLAGKKAVCKQCGNRMVVPGEGVAEDRPAPAARPVAAPSARTASGLPVAKLVSSRQPPAHDLYGFDEEPSALPPIAPRLGASPESAETPVKKKKKKKGFFASTKAKSPSSGGGISGLRMIFIGLAIASGLYGGVRGFGLLSKSEVVAFHQRVVDRFDALTATIAAVTSLESARAAAPKCGAILEALIQDMDTNGRKKGRIEDIRAVEREIMPRLIATRERLDGQMLRLQRIPGAVEALAIEAPMTRLAAIASELAAENAKLGVQ